MKLTGTFSALLLIMLVLTTSCAVDSVEKRLSEAEIALQASDYDTASNLASELMKTDSISPLGCNSLCRLSLIFMQLSEHQNHEENVALATYCYHSAITNYSDSAFAYFNALPIEKDMYVFILSELNKFYNIDRESITVDDECIESLQDDIYFSEP